MGNISTLPTGMKHWRSMASNKLIDDEELFTRLHEYWSLTSTLGGLIAGFSYVVISEQGVEFTEQIGVSGHNRKEMYYWFGITTFFTSLGTALITSALLTALMMIGKRDIRWFILRFDWLFQLPSGLLGYSILSMGCGTISLFSELVGATNGVYYYANVIFFLVLFGCGIGFYVMMKSSQFLDQRYGQNLTQKEMLATIQKMVDDSAPGAGGSGGANSDGKTEIGVR